MGEPSRASYDVAVIGSGVGGLISAALLARAGLSVLVAEQHEGPGGYAHAFDRGDHVFDPGVHMVGDPRLYSAIVEHLDVRGEVTHLPVDRLFTGIFPGMRMQVPATTIQDVADAHAELADGRRQEVREFFELAQRMHAELHEMPGELSMSGMAGVEARLPAVFRYRRATVADVAGEVIADPRAKAVCSAFSAVFGQRPSELPFQSFAQALGTYLQDGVFYYEGGAQTFIDALVTALCRDGGELLVQSAVSRVVIEDGKAAGVELEGGAVVRAPVVISNAAAPATFERLVGYEHLPERFVRTVRRLEPSISGAMLLAASSLDLREHDVSHMVFHYPSWDLEDAFGADWDSRLMGLFTPSLVDPTLAPEGEHVMNAIVFAHYEAGRPWSEERERVRSALMARLEELFPGFARAQTFGEMATPLTLERFTRNTGGAIYGYEATFAQTGSRRPAQRTPIGGLYLAGHWTRPGSGFLRATVSGIHTAQMVAADGFHPGAEIAFEYDRLPPAM